MIKKEFNAEFSAQESAEILIEGGAKVKFEPNSIKDTDGNIGIIKGLDADIHNVEVEYLNGGMGLYCLDKDCDKYDPLYICI